MIKPLDLVLIGGVAIIYHYHLYKIAKKHVDVDIAVFFGGLLLIGLYGQKLQPSSFTYLNVKPFFLSFL